MEASLKARGCIVLMERVLKEESQEDEQEVAEKEA